MYNSTTLHTSVNIRVLNRTFHSNNDGSGRELSYETKLLNLLAFGIVMLVDRAYNDVMIANYFHGYEVIT